MVLLLNKIFLGLLLVFLAVSCATTVSDSDKLNTTSTKQGQMSPEELLAEVNLDFMRLIEDARKKGDDAVEYLITDFFVKANDASIRGDSQTAVFLYKYLVELDKDNSFLRKKYAVELVKVSELGKAEDVLLTLYEKGKLTDIDVGLMLGGIQLTKNEVDKARKSYNDVLSLDRSHVEACVFLAKTYVGEKKYMRAKKIINNCERVGKKSPIFKLFLGSISIEEQNILYARKMFRQALRIDPSYYKAVLAIGATYEQGEEYLKAATEYKKYLKKYPDNYYIIAQVVQTMFASGKLKGIIPYLEKLVEQDSSDLNSKVKLGVLYTEEKQYKKAKRVFKEILDVVPDSDKVLYSLGSIYQIIGEPDMAIEYFSRIQVESDLYNDSSLQIARMLQVRAVKEFQDNAENTIVSKFEKYIDERLKEKGPYLIEFAVIKSGFFDETGRAYEAVRIIEDVAKVEGFNDAHAYYLASLYDRVGKKNDSRAVIEGIIERDPKNAHALNFLGYSLLEHEDEKEWAKAHDYIKAAAEINPEDGYIRDSLGWYYYKTGDYLKAKTEILKAWNIEKKDPIIGKHLSLVYQKLKEYDKARKYLVEALQYCTQEDQKEDINEALKELDSMMRLPASK